MEHQNCQKVVKRITESYIVFHFPAKMQYCYKSLQQMMLQQYAVQYLDD